MAGVYTVSQINSYIRNLFVRDYALSNIRVKGEVSNCKYHTSGHIYFTLKDAGAAISCVLFASARQGLTFRMQDGQEVEAGGQITFYEKNGSCQLYVKRVSLAGRGELYERFERLKAELLEMGMFDPCYKKPIPSYAMKIGIVTAPTGAAIRDIESISRRRNPYVRLTLYPALVQGEQAKYSIAEGIRTLDRMGLDVIIVGRGGGSIEDLWAFNEELVARAVFDAETPIISAVGHETDFTITDFAADLRAPTPSAAAELANFEYRVFEEEIESRRQQLSGVLSRTLRERSRILSEYRYRLQLLSPAQVLGDQSRRLSLYKKELMRAAAERLREKKTALLSREAALCAAAEAALSGKKQRLCLLSARLDALSPLRKISGGYAYLADETGSGVRSLTQLTEGSRIEAYVRDGSFEAVVTKIKKEQGHGGREEENGEKGTGD